MICFINIILTSIRPSIRPSVRPSIRPSENLVLSSVPVVEECGVDGTYVVHVLVPICEVERMA
jgi:hypothetical protein